MEQTKLPLPDKNGIIRALPHDLSEVNQRRLNKFSAFMFLYDSVQDHFVRPRIHKADWRQHRETLKKEISKIKKSRVLDIGCGTGAAITLFHDSNEYTGLDLSYPMLKHAVKKAKNKSFPKSVFIQGNAEVLLFNNASFDFILMDTALHMIPEYQMSIAEVGRILVRKGQFLCSTPAVGINDAFDVTWSQIAEKRDLHSFNEEDIHKVCLNHGLSYHQIDTNGGVLYFLARKTN